MPPSSAPNSTGRERCMNRSQSHKKDSKINDSQATLQLKSGDSEPAQRNILRELRERSKYLPALLKEFKKLEVKCSGDDFQASTNRPHTITSIGAKKTTADITCATILAAIRTTKESEGTKRSKWDFH